MIDVVLYLVGFLLLIVLQGLVINGFYESTNDGMIFNKYKIWLKTLPSWIGKPFGLCAKCMASVFGFITYWPVVLMFFGFHWQEITIFIFDVFSLVTVNWLIYKRF